MRNAKLSRNRQDSDFARLANGGAIWRSGLEINTGTHLLTCPCQHTLSLSRRECVLTADRIKVIVMGMTHETPPDHFKGKSVSEHLKEARTQGSQASTETHGAEMPGHLAAGADSAKNTAISLFLIWIILEQSTIPRAKIFIILVIFSFGWVIWMIGRSASLGWARLERLHRLIEQERWEIEHHRHREKEELREMYRAKGFEGKLLDEIVDVLMADDNRLLRVMLEEELGLSLEAYEHPLKQGVGAATGTILTVLLSLLGFYAYPSFGLPLFAGILFVIATIVSAKAEKNRRIQATIRNLSIALLTLGVTYFLSKLLEK